MTDTTKKAPFIVAPKAASCISFVGVEVQDLHRFHGIGDMAECIDADVAKRLGIRHGTDAEGIENNDKNAVTGVILRLLSWFMFLRFAFP